MQLSRAAISRNMKLLGQRMEKVGEKWNDTGYGLIDVVPYPYDTRGYAAMLSTKGKQLIKQLEQIVGGQDDNQTG